MEKEEMLIDGNKFEATLEKWADEKYHVHIESDSKTFPMRSVHEITLKDDSKFKAVVYGHGAVGFRKPQEGIPINLISLQEI